MNTLTLFAIASLLSLHAAAPVEWIEMTAGPDVGVSYNPAVWKPSVGLKVPEPGTPNSWLGNFSALVRLRSQL